MIIIITVIIYCFIFRQVLCTSQITKVALIKGHESKGTSHVYKNSVSKLLSSMENGKRGKKTDQS